MTNISGLKTRIWDITAPSNVFGLDALRLFVKFMVILYSTNCVKHNKKKCILMFYCCGQVCQTQYTRFWVLMHPTMVEVLDNNLQNATDKLVPIKGRTMLVRATNPWFNNEMRDQKRKMRNQEKKWRKYKLESNWKVFKSERVKYRQMLREARKVKIAEGQQMW